MYKLLVKNGPEVKCNSSEMAYISTTGGYNGEIGEIGAYRDVNRYRVQEFFRED